MDEGSFIWVIEEMNANGVFRTRMDNGSIVFVIWAINYIGVALILDGRIVGHS